MNRFKKFSLLILSTFLFVCSSFIFAGCDSKDKESKLYVFATKGGYVQVGDNTDYIEFGDEGSKIFTFDKNSKIELKAVPNRGYNFVKWQCTNQTTEVTEAQFSLEMTEDEIVVKAIFEIDTTTSLNVAYPTDATGYSIALESGYSNVVALGGDFKFRVNLMEDYSNSNIVVKANNVVITAVNGVYTISNIEEDITITVEGVVLNQTPDEPDEPSVPTYGIFEIDTRFSLVPVSHTTCEVKEGESFVFEIALTTGYKYGDNVVVKANDDEIVAVDGKYTINNITTTIKISVIGIVEDIEEPTPEPTKYTITTSETTYTILSVSHATCEVEEGENFKFAISIKEGYKAEGSLVVKANGVVLTEVETNRYLVENVTENIVITVTGIVEDIEEPTPEPTKYTITTLEATYTILSVSHATCEVEEGENFKFAISIKEGYKAEGSLVVKANGVVLTEVETNRYLVENVTENIVITVTGIVEDIEEPTPEPTKYTITIVGGNFTITPNISSGCEIEEGESFAFSISVNSGYKKGDNFKVTANGVELIENNGTYTIQSVICNTTIAVEGIVEDIVEVKHTIYTNDDKFTINPVGTTSFEVVDGQSFTFTISLAQGYKFADNVEVMANGITLINNNNEYTIGSVDTDMEITVNGIVADVPEVQPVTYTFTLGFEDGASALDPEIEYAIPETITFSIKEDEKLNSYKASQFMVTTDQQVDKSLGAIIDDIISVCGYYTSVLAFEIDGVEFIEVNGENITFNWDVLELVSDTDNLIIIME